MNNKIVITGLGIVSPLGLGKDKFWQSLISGKNSIKKIKNFNTRQYRTHHGGQVPSFSLQKYIQNKKNKMGSVSKYAVAATAMALKDAQLKPRDISTKKIGVFIGTTLGEAQDFNKIVSVYRKNKGLKIPLSLIRNIPTNSIPNNIAKTFDLKSSNLAFLTACSAGNAAISAGFELIKAGKLDLAIVGGAEAFSLQKFAGFNQLGAVATRKCQPFSRNRQGLILSEGAGILIIESEKLARQRDAYIYGEILGYGASCDAYHLTNLDPTGEGIIRAYKDLFKSIKISKQKIDYINAHGTGTIDNDRIEVKALKKLFGKKIKQIPISSIKSMLGHSMGAASAIEAIACALVINQGVIPPTINYESLDPECDIDCVPNNARYQKVNIALSNSFGFGGNNVILAIGAYSA